MSGAFPNQERAEPQKMAVRLGTTRYFSIDGQRHARAVFGEVESWGMAGGLRI